RTIAIASVSSATIRKSVSLESTGQNALLCSDHLAVLLPPVRGTTGDRQNDPTLVWRILRRLEHLHALFSARAAPWLCLRTHPEQTEAAQAGHSPHFAPGHSSGGA